MGSLVSAVVANLYMEFFEELALEMTPIRPRLLMILLHPQEGLNRGTPLPSQRGQADHQVHFGAGRFSFLDTLLRRRGDGSLAVSQAEQLSCELHLQCLCPAHTGNSRHKQRYVFVCLFVL